MNRVLAVAVVAACLSSSFGVHSGETQKWPFDLKHAVARYGHGDVKQVRAGAIDALFVKPSARAAGYTKVHLKGFEVILSRDFKMRKFSSAGRDLMDVERVVEGADALAREALGRSLQDGGYDLVDAPGPDVVDADVHIVDLWLAATAESQRTGNEVYSASLGRMSLNVELSDSTTGESILTAFDQEVAPPPDNAHKTSSECAAWMIKTLGVWAESMRKGLDISNGKNPAGT